MTEMNEIKERVETRPLRPTMRPLVDEIIVQWRDYMILFYYMVESIDFCCFWRKRDQPTDRPTDSPVYRDARTHLKTKEHQRREFTRKLFCQ